jgi:electron transport complex protein RnfG
MSTADTAQVTTAVTHDSTNVFKMLRALAGIATLSGLILAATYQATFSIIEKNKIEQLRAAVFEVLPESTTDQAAFEITPDGKLAALESGETENPVIYAGYDAQGALTGVAIPASGLGYGDIIRVLYGYDPTTQALTGFKVLESKETPGLGDRIGMMPFVGNFIGMAVPLNDTGEALLNPVETVKAGTKTEPWQVDAISGATISSKAVGEMIRQSTDTMLPLIYKQADQLKRNS